jgi:branched-chain amino acid transport system ATP-binding protein
MTLLRLHEITVRFGGVTALDGVDMCVGTGEVVGLIGPNGAGKSTLFNVLSGQVRAQSGRALFRGHDLLRAAPDKRARAGIGRTFQTPRMLPTETVLENLLVAAEAHDRTGLFGDMLLLPWAQRERRRARQRALDVLEQVGLADRAQVAAGELPLPAQRRVEIARALSLDPTLLLLDESASGLNDQETGELGAVLARIVGERRGSAILVEHDVDFVLSLADHLYVLDFGRVIASGEPAAVVRDPAVVTAYLGADQGRWSVA